MSAIYKTLDGTTGSYGHGNYTDYMPKGKRPGKWLPPVEPILCRSGYHVCRDLREVLEHVGPDLYEVEVKGACAEGGDKAAYEQMRLVRRIPEWNETTCRLFAVDCARLAANRYAAPDKRALIHATLDTAVGFAEGRVDRAALAAARAAARGAARGAAWGAAWAAARAAARAAAWGAAWGAARDAARDAAWDAAWDEQLQLLRRYLAGEVGPLVEEES